MSVMLNGCFPDTEYFEITATSGRRYGIWVTMPPGSGSSDEPLPLVYVLDGNWSVGLTAPLVVAQRDPYLSITPYIQVSVGYAGEDATRWETLRNRDLVPPGEPLNDATVSTLNTAREDGHMSQDQVDGYLAELRDTRADEFLTFLTQELHPHLVAYLPVSESGHGLFGYSYGGLFALYAWLQHTPLFATVGAGSPGVLSSESRVFAMIEAMPSGAEVGRGHLHLTVNEVEALGTVPVYRQLGQAFLTVVDRLQSLDGPSRVSTALMHETHVTGLQASFLSYLKNCRSSADQGGARV